MLQFNLIAHNLRSSHNVGSLLRTADGLGVNRVYLSGYTPYPFLGKLDPRLPHISQKVHKQIAKTSLGAEESVDWVYEPDIFNLIEKLSNEGFKIFALEQTENSISLPEFKPPEKIALILGREVEGLEKEVIVMCENSLEIPMLGKKESFNVAVAAAMALYHLRYIG